MNGNSNAFKVVIALVLIMVGIFVYINFNSETINNQGGGIDGDSSSSVSRDVAGEEEGAEETNLSAQEAAVVELCDCFKEVLDYKQKIAENPQVEFEENRQITKARIVMRSCYTKTKQRHTAFGEDLIEGFQMACPEAQEEL